MLTIGGSNPNLSLPSGASFVPESMRNSLNRCASIIYSPTKTGKLEEIPGAAMNLLHNMVLPHHHIN